MSKFTRQTEQRFVTARKLIVVVLSLAVSCHEFCTLIILYSKNLQYSGTLLIRQPSGHQHVVVITGGRINEVVTLRK